MSEQLHCTRCSKNSVRKRMKLNKLPKQILVRGRTYLSSCKFNISFADRV
jgi:ubiquitin C-terminal hydrolase